MKHQYLLGAAWAVLTFLLGAWLAALAVGGSLKDCEALGKTRLAGVPVECKVIK